MSDLLKLIDDYCRRNGISASGFERKCDLGNGLVGKWRKGIVKPSIGSLSKIKEHTGLPVTKFIKEIGVERNVKG